MVDEFSTSRGCQKAQFGTMMWPKPQADGLPDARWLSEITFTTAIPELAIPAKFDRRLISQALTNIIKNATEAIAALPEADKEPGKIHVS